MSPLKGLNRKEEPRLIKEDELQPSMEYPDESESFETEELQYSPKQLNEKEYFEPQLIKGDVNQHSILEQPNESDPFAMKYLQPTENEQRFVKSKTGVTEELQLIKEEDFQLSQQSIEQQNEDLSVYTTDKSLSRDQQNKSQLCVRTEEAIEKDFVQPTMEQLSESEPSIFEPLQKADQQNESESGVIKEESQLVQSSMKQLNESQPSMSESLEKTLSENQQNEHKCSVSKLGHLANDDLVQPSVVEQLSTSSSTALSENGQSSPSNDKVSSLSNKEDAEPSEEGSAFVREYVQSVINKSVILYKKKEYN